MFKMFRNTVDVRSQNKTLQNQNNNYHSTEDIWYQTQEFKEILWNITKTLYRLLQVRKFLSGALCIFLSDLQLSVLRTIFELSRYLLGRLDPV